MALAMLASLVESFLNEARLRLDEKIFPAKTTRGKWLLRRVSEYKERFKIDLEALPGFEGVREVVLARNSCLHNGGRPCADYLKQTKHRLLEEVNDLSLVFRQNPGGEDRVISFDLQTLKGIVSEISEFADSLHKSLNAVRPEDIFGPPASN